MSSSNSVNESGVQYSNRSTTSKSVMSSRDLISSPTRNSSADDPPASKKRVEPSKSSLPNTSRQISSTVWPRSGCGDVGKIEVGVRLEILSQSVPTSGQGLLRRRGQQHRRGPNLWCSSGVRRASQHRVGVGAAHAERTDGAVLDRCTGEQKLETISLRQDPSFVASILRNYVDDPDIDPARFEQAQRDRQVAFERDALSSLAPKDRKRLVGIMQKARAAVRARESMRLIRTRIVGVGRAIYCEVGRLLAAAGELADEPPNQFETFGPPYSKTTRYTSQIPVEQQDGRVLRGTGCWPGIVEGDIQVVLSPTDDLSVNGKILTTMRTDPVGARCFPVSRAC